MRAYFAGFVVLAGIAGAGPPQPETSTRPMEQTIRQGRWRVLVATEDGWPLTDCKNSVVVFTPDRMIIKQGNSSADLGYRIDAVALPARIDVSLLEKREGIFNFDGQVLRICVSKRGEKRPREFSSPPGSERLYLLLKME